MYIVVPNPTMGNGNNIVERLHVSVVHSNATKSSG